MIYCGPLGTNSQCLVDYFEVRGRFGHIRRGACGVCSSSACMKKRVVLVLVHVDWKLKRAYGMSACRLFLILHVVAGSCNLVSTHTHPDSI